MDATIPAKNRVNGVKECKIIRKDPNVFVPSDAVISHNCIISTGVVLSPGVILGENVKVGPNVVFVSPEMPEDVPARVGDNVKIGANATIYPNITLASNSVVHPGSVVTRSVPPAAIVEGNPALIVGYVDAMTPSTVADRENSANKKEYLTASGVSLHHFAVIPDLRGNLTVGEFNTEIPFVPLRYFMVFGVPSREIRGEHAHHKCQQFLICARGSCSVVVDDGSTRVEVALDAPNKGLYLPPMIWGVQYKYSQDALLLVFASHNYDSDDYIRNYDDYLKLVGVKNGDRVV